MQSTSILVLIFAFERIVFSFSGTSSLCLFVIIKERYLNTLLTNAIGHGLGPRIVRDLPSSLRISSTSLEDSI